ncbi:MAG: DNA alkylation repair protein [Thermoanaerobaculia bacterium]
MPAKSLHRDPSARKKRGPQDDTAGVLPGTSYQQPGTNAKAILTQLRQHADPARAAGMASYGISGSKLLGVSMLTLREIGKRHRNDHALAAALWKSGIHEARILASIVDDPAAVTADQMDEWVSAFDSWDVCDQCCLNLFHKTPHAWEKAIEWSARDEEFVKRAAFALMAVLARGARQEGDGRPLPVLAADHRPGKSRRSQLREESGQLGAAPDRKAQRRSPRQGDPHRRKHCEDRIAVGTMDRKRRVAGVDVEPFALFGVRRQRRRFGTGN